MIIERTWISYHDNPDGIIVPSMSGQIAMEPQQAVSHMLSFIAIEPYVSPARFTDPQNLTFDVRWYPRIALRFHIQTDEQDFEPVLQMLAYIYAMTGVEWDLSAEVFARHPDGPTAEKCAELFKRFTAAGWCTALLLRGIEPVERFLLLKINDLLAALELVDEGHELEEAIATG